MRNTNVPWLIVIVAIILLCLSMVLPTQVNYFGREIKVRPGLDVSGGLRVLMQAEGAQVTADQLDLAKRIISNRINTLGVSEPVVQVAGSTRIIIELPDIRDPQRALSLVQTTALLEFVNFSAVGSCSGPMPQEKEYILTDRQVQIRQGQATSPTAEATAAATPVATAAATDQATPQPTAAATKETSQNLLFKEMQQATPEPTAQPTAEPTAAPTAAATAEVTPAPTASNIPGSQANPKVNPCTGRPFETVMTGAGLRDAQPQLNSQTTQYVVQFSLNTSNAEAQNFARHTAANIGQPLAIVLDGQVLSAPVIRAALTDGGVIEGNFSAESSRDLSTQLKSGALPISLRVESLEQVGASLGAESVQASIKAGILGLLTVFLFLLIYYRVGGIAASLALIVFALINFALYKFIPVTLTLSAITGFLISIGSAIDGNILVFERIKEELRAGRTLKKAVDSGFSRAFSSIRDSNVSTILIAFILYFFGAQFGASAVRGFAVTLIMGLLINMFTTLIVTRVFLGVLLDLGGERLGGGNLFGRLSHDKSNNA